MFDIKDSIKIQSIQQAIDYLNSNEDAWVVCGGTDLLIKIRLRKLSHITLLDISEIDELKGITRNEGELIIGAAETFNEIASNPFVMAYANALSLSSSLVGGHEIRNVATIGGNLCNGAVSAESAAPLLAHDATLLVVGDGYVRKLSIHDFYISPGKTALKRGEILKEIRIPINQAANCGSTYIKFGQRKAMEIPTLGCAAEVSLSVDLGELSNLRLSFTLAGPVPMRCFEVEKELNGSLLTAKTFKTISDIVEHEITPRDSWRVSREYRIQLAKELAIRATKQAVHLAGGHLHE